MLFLTIIVYSIIQILIFELARICDEYYRVELNFNSISNTFLIQTVISLLYRYYILIIINYIDIFHKKKKIQIQIRYILAYIIIISIIVVLDLCILPIYLVYYAFKLD